MKGEFEEIGVFIVDRQIGKGQSAGALELCGACHGVVVQGVRGKDHILLVVPADTELQGVVFVGVDTVVVSAEILCIAVDGAAGEGDPVGAAERDNAVKVPLNGIFVKPCVGVDIPEALVVARADGGGIGAEGVGADGLIGVDGQSQIGVVDPVKVDECGTGGGAFCQVQIDFKTCGVDGAVDAVA